MQKVKKIIRAKELAKTIGVSSVTIWRWRQKKIIPEPISLGTRIIGWEQSTIDEWIDSLKKPSLENPKN